MKRLRPALLILAIAVLAISAAGCIRAASSRGWAAPVEFDSYLLVSTDKGRLDAIDPDTGELIWRFPGSDASTWYFPTRGAEPIGGPGFPALAADLAAGDANAELTTTSGIKKGESVAIGDEIVGIFELRGNIATLVRGNNAADHSLGDRVVPLREDPPDKLTGIYAEPVLSDGIIYVADYSGFVYALKERAGGLPGRALWYRELDGNLIGDIALDETTGNLFVPSSNGKLYALKSADGSDAFPPFATEKRIWAGPLVDDDKVYVASGDGGLYALDTATGATVGAPFRAEGDLMTRPVLAGGLILIGSFDNRVYAVNPDTGAAEWSFLADNWVWSRPLVDGDSVYVADFSGRVYALNLADGSEAWDAPFDTGTAIRSGAVLVDGILVVATKDGELWGVHAESGAPAWGPVAIGASLEGNLALLDAAVIVVPSACVEVGEGDFAQRVNYFSIDPSNGAIDDSARANQGC